MNLQNLLKIFSDLKCTQVYIKSLSPNDNSKNQIYLARGTTDVLNMFPVKEFLPQYDGIRKSETFFGIVDFNWLHDDGNYSPAPHAKFIVYPDYPEVRFSAFLRGCYNAPSELMNRRENGRLLFMGISEEKIFGYVVSSQSEIINEVRNSPFVETEGVFHLISLEGRQIITDTKNKLLKELKRIHELGWIKSKRLDKHGAIIDCYATQCGGYTLEAELGIIPNAKPEPDYLGYELKQFGVSNFDKLDSKRITLITPEPDGGFYGEKGLKEFVYKYGYADSKNTDRLNFGGVFKNGVMAKKTKMTLTLSGFDTNSNKIINTTGGIYLLDDKGNEAASWSFASILYHWNKKHAKASYIPSKVLKEPFKQYYYGNKIILAHKTDFNLFLQQLANGNVFYDPGIKVENVSTKPQGKPRSQFRIKSGHLNLIYNEFEIVDLNII